MSVNEAPVFSSIKDVSKRLALPSHVLRFWETKFPEISPVQRGKGCRYYRQEDVELIERIKYLLYEKRYTIEGARAVLKSERKGASPVDKEYTERAFKTSLKNDLLSIKELLEASLK